MDVQCYDSELHASFQSLCCRLLVKFLLCHRPEVGSSLTKLLETFCILHCNEKAEKGTPGTRLTVSDRTTVLARTPDGDFPLRVTRCSPGHLAECQRAQARREKLIGC